MTQESIYLSSILGIYFQLALSHTCIHLDLCGCSGSPHVRTEAEVKAVFGSKQRNYHIFDTIAVEMPK